MLGGDIEHVQSNDDGPAEPRQFAGGALHLRDDVGDRDVRAQIIAWDRDIDVLIELENFGNQGAIGGFDELDCVLQC